VGRIGRELRPEALDDLGLVNALIALCSRVDRQGRIRIRRALEWQIPALPAEVELVIYRAAQEALTNALRHADATDVLVALKYQNARIELIVSDNGCGLSEHVNEHGLRGMRERAMLIDAKLEIRAARGGGTEIVLTVSV
jgi:two-component system sensor histidine kinase UhpB